jgi:hypothetical protein
MGIIAILGVLGNVAIRLSIQKSRSAACTSNLRQIYGGLQAYASDNNQAIPVMLPLRASKSDPGPTLDTALTAYLPDASIFHCPADATLFAQSGCSYLWDYGLSVNAQGQQNGSMVAPTFPLLKTTNTTQIPFISDKQSFHATTPSSHTIYADGHVE